MQRRVGESPSKFSQRRFCSHECARAKYKRRTNPSSLDGNHENTLDAIAGHLGFHRRTIERNEKNALARLRKLEFLREHLA